MSKLCIVVLYAMILAIINAYVLKSMTKGMLEKRGSVIYSKTTVSMSTQPKTVEVSIPLGEGYKPFVYSFRPLFQKSEFYVFTYPVPFGLNIEKPNKKKVGSVPAPVVTAPGSLGNAGEQVGDVLRATTCWSQGFQAAGAASDISMFAGNIKWRMSVFDTTGAPWEQVVEALISNTEERSKTVTLVFERPLEESDNNNSSGTPE